MVLTNKKLSILAGVAGAMLVTTVIVYSGGFFEPEPGFMPGTTLIQGMKPQDIAKIKVTRGDDTLTFRITERQVVLVQRQNYPADIRKINDLWSQLADITCAAEITVDKEDHKELGVADGDSGATVVTLIDKADKTITGVIIGRSAGRRGLGVYARLVGQDAVYATKTHVRFSTTASDYMDTELMKVPAEEVEEVTVTPVGKKDQACVVTRDKDRQPALAGVPKGKRVRHSELDSLMEALAELKIQDVATDPKAAENPDTIFTCRTNTYRTFIVNLSKKDDKHYVAVACAGPSRAVLESLGDPAKDDTPGIAEQREAASSAMLYVRVFSGRHLNWVYEISSFDADKMRKTLDDLTEDIPIAASHILIGYKGSQKSEATRTKEEARKLAEEILAKVKAPGADFAELAKKHSEGPSGPKGGDLGEFDKKTMHENFTKASWNLKVGEISGVVETPFGFHVIKRTK